jgi:hypothetical protein
MTLPIVRSGVDEAVVMAKTASVGASPVTAWTTAPIKGTLIRVYGVLEGTITTASAAVAVKINGGSDLTGGGFSLAVGAAGTGSSFEFNPMSVGTGISEGDFISFTPSSASGANIPATFQAVIREH